MMIPHEHRPNSEEPATALQTALTLLDLGLWPVLITPHDPADPQAGKRPIGEKWGMVRPTDESLREAFARHPGAGLGLRLGPKGGVIDLDCDGPQAQETLERIFGGELVETLGWDSQRGQHLLLAWDDRLLEYGINVAEKHPHYPGVGLRFGADHCKQFQSVCPPSLTSLTLPDGRVVPGQSRRWNGCWTIASIPAAMFADLDRFLVQSPQRRPIVVEVAGPFRGFDPPLDRYAQSALTREVERLYSTPIGDRNNQLNVAAFNLGQLVASGLLDVTEVYQALESTAFDIGLGDRESQATIRSGLTSGQSHPRDLSKIESTLLEPYAVNADDAVDARRSPDSSEDPSPTILDNSLNCKEIGHLAEPARAEDGGSESRAGGPHALYSQYAIGVGGPGDPSGNRDPNGVLGVKGVRPSGGPPEGQDDPQAQPADIPNVHDIKELRQTSVNPEGDPGGLEGVNGVKGVRSFIQTLEDREDSRRHPSGVRAFGRPSLDQDDERPIVIRAWPAPPNPAVWYGPVGELARAIDPFTEADPVGVLAQTLVAFGNLIGRKPYVVVNATRHYPNLFACTAGPTSMGRKGTAWDIVKMVMSSCDPDWVLNRVTGGMVSGEGLIWEVRDPIRMGEEVRDPGVDDKRLLAIETEMGGLLKILTREGNNLSALIRQAWDTGFLRSMTKNNPNRSTDAHISIIGHITEHEVSTYLTKMDAANGFANRFLWFAVKQSKYLPDGAAIPHEAIRPHLDRIRQAAQWAFAVRVERDPEARTLWHSVYPRLCRGRPGLIGSLTNRAAAQVVRLALIYATLDCSCRVERPHLEAALALWDYSERSVAYIFGESLGDKDADHLLSVLRSSPLGLSRTQIRSDVFKRNKSSDEIGRILGRLLEANLVRYEVIKTEGRDKTVWHALDALTPTDPPTPGMPSGGQMES